jgi:hypothetical protein
LFSSPFTASEQDRRRQSDTTCCYVSCTIIVLIIPVVSDSYLALADRLRQSRCRCIVYYIEGQTYMAYYREGQVQRRVQRTIGSGNQPAQDDEARRMAYHGEGQVQRRGQKINGSAIATHCLQTEHVTWRIWIRKGTAALLMVSGVQACAGDHQLCIRRGHVRLAEQRHPRYIPSQNCTRVRPEEEPGLGPPSMHRRLYIQPADARLTLPNRPPTDTGNPLRYARPLA